MVSPGLLFQKLKEILLYQLEKKNPGLLFKKFEIVFFFSQYILLKLLINSISTSISVLLNLSFSLIHKKHC